MRAVIRKPGRIVPLCVAALFFLTIYLSSFPYGVRVIFYPMCREIKRQSFALNIRGFKIMDSANFRIYYRASSAGIINMVDDDAEEDLAKVMEDYDYHIKNKIDVVVYSEYEEMASKIGLGAGSTAMGVYYEGIIGILDPAKWVQSNENVKDTFKKDGPVAHELTHYILDYISGGNVPVWFTEGAALYEEYRINGAIWGEGIEYKSFYSMKELENGFYKLDETKAYRESFLIVKYIGDNYGISAIREIAAELGSGRSMGQAVEKVLVMPEDELVRMSLIG